VGPLLVETNTSNTIDLAALVPAELAGSEFAADYVASLVVEAHVGGVHHTMPDAFVAYVHGTAMPPVIWTRDTMLASAPNGLLSPTLAEQAHAAGVEGQVIPPYDPPPERVRKLDGPLDDTGVEQGGSP
jgi:hypothetical protein